MIQDISAFLYRMNSATTLLLSLFFSYYALAQDKKGSIAQPEESDYYEIRTVPIP